MTVVTVLTGADSQLGRRIAELRRVFNLTGSELAALIRVSPETLRAYERGTLRVTPDHLLAIASRLGVPLVFFFSDCSTPASRYDLDLYIGQLLAADRDASGMTIARRSTTTGPTHTLVGASSAVNSSKF